MRTAFLDVIEYLDEVGGRLPNTGPALPGPVSLDKRFSDMAAAWDEFGVAVHGRDLDGTAQALAQLCFAAFATAIELGIDLPSVWDAVRAHYMQRAIATRAPTLARLAAEDCPGVATLLAQQQPLAALYARDFESERQEVLLASLRNNAAFADKGSGAIQVPASLLHSAVEEIERLRHRPITSV